MHAPSVFRNCSRSLGTFSIGRYGDVFEFMAARSLMYFVNTSIRGAEERVTSSVQGEKIVERKFSTFGLEGKLIELLLNEAAAAFRAETKSPRS